MSDKTPLEEIKDAAETAVEAVEETVEEVTEAVVAKAEEVVAQITPAPQAASDDDDEDDGPIEYDEDDVPPASDEDDDDDDDDDDDTDADGDDEYEEVEGPSQFQPQQQRGRRGFRASRQLRNELRLEDIHYKNIELLSKFVDPRGRILSRRKTKISAKMQRRITTAIKRARHLALLPYTADHIRITRSGK